VTMTIAAGTVNVEPAYTACKWMTRNVTVSGNTFHHSAATVLAGYTLPSGVITGKMAMISQYGTFPSWSPYLGDTISQAITFDQNNVWANNTYVGDYRWMPFDTGHNLSFAQWQASPYGQDVGSTFSP